MDHGIAKGCSGRIDATSTLMSASLRAAMLSRNKCAPGAHTHSEHGHRSWKASKIETTEFAHEPVINPAYASNFVDPVGWKPKGRLQSVCVTAHSSEGHASATSLTFSHHQGFSGGSALCAFWLPVSCTEVGRESSPAPACHMCRVVVRQSVPERALPALRAAQTSLSSRQRPGTPSENSRLERRRRLQGFWQRCRRRRRASALEGKLDPAGARTGSGRAEQPDWKPGVRCPGSEAGQARGVARRLARARGLAKRMAAVVAVRRTSVSQAKQARNAGTTCCFSFVFGHGPQAGHGFASSIAAAWRQTVELNASMSNLPSADQQHYWSKGVSTFSFFNARLSPEGMLDNDRIWWHNLDGSMISARDCTIQIGARTVHQGCTWSRRKSSVDRGYERSSQSYCEGNDSVFQQAVESP